MRRETIPSASPRVKTGAIKKRSATKANRRSRYLGAARLLALQASGWVNFKCQTWVSFKRSLTPEQERSALQRGFEALYQGETGLRTALATLKQRQQSGRPYFSRDFGAFYGWLKAHGSCEALSPLRNVTMSIVLRNYPVRPGQNILGYVNSQTRRLTFDKAWRISGIGRARLKDILFHLNSGTPTEQRHDLTPEDLARAIKFWDKCLELRKAADLLHVHTGQIKPLVKSEVLSSFTFGSALIYVDRASVDRLLSIIATVPESSCTKDHIPLSDYCRLNGVSLARLLCGLLAGEIIDLRKVTVKPGIRGLAIPRHLVIESHVRALDGDLRLRA